MEGFAGKVAVVTGGGRGIGRGIVESLAAEKVRVVVNDIYRDDSGRSAADDAVEAVKAVGGDAVANYETVATWEGSRRLVEAAVEAFGRVDILVLCAGNLNVTPLVDLTEEEWDATMAVHLKGHVSCAQAAAKSMIAQGDGGRIVMISSRAAFFGMSPAYPAAKAGIMGLSAALARELAPHGITVNCLLPSAQTQLFPGDLSSRPQAGGTPLPSDIAPESLAPLVTYLVSSEAARVTGRFMYATGGDICFYPDPLVVSNAPTFLRKPGRWTADELSDTIPPLIGL